MTDDDILAFLRDHLKTDDVPHSRRTLFVHLVGTYEILQSWNNSAPVCRAGLYHSIYGTWHFRHKAFPIAERRVISDLIGDAAERLVYLFCVTKRPQAFLTAYRDRQADTAKLMDYYTGLETEVAIGDLAALLEIEAANLLEQRGNIAGNLKDILQTDISVPARNALLGYLSAQQRLKEAIFAD